MDIIRWIIFCYIDIYIHPDYLMHKIFTQILFRNKQQRRHVLLYENQLIFCKQVPSLLWWWQELIHGNYDDHSDQDRDDSNDHDDFVLFYANHFSCRSEAAPATSSSSASQWVLIIIIIIIIVIVVIIINTVVYPTPGVEMLSSSLSSSSLSIHLVNDSCLHLWAYFHQISTRV